MSIDAPILVTAPRDASAELAERSLRSFVDAVFPSVRSSDAKTNEPTRCERSVPRSFVGDLTRAGDVARALEGCQRMYFGMSVSAPYLEATVTTAAVARSAVTWRCWSTSRR